MTRFFSQALLVCVLTASVAAQAPSGEGGKIYADAPNEITSEAKYLTLGRLCYTGQMVEAEAKANEVLGLGYKGTRYECWVHDKLAAGYEKIGDSSKAIAAYTSAMTSSDPQKGSYTRARDRILAMGGTPPAEVAGSIPAGPVYGSKNPPAAPPVAQSGQRHPSAPPPPSGPSAPSTFSSPASPASPAPPTASTGSTPAPAMPASAQLANGQRTYKEAPREITSEAKYLTLGRLCYAGQMAEAEQKAQEVLALGYAGTRYECWVHDKLASGYEKVGNTSAAIEAYRKALTSSDPAKGSYSRARDRITALGGSL